jgi:hypothetical protein
MRHTIKQVITGNFNDKTDAMQFFSITLGFLLSSVLLFVAGIPEQIGLPDWVGGFIAFLWLAMNFDCILIMVQAYRYAKKHKGSNAS